jgi:hypothetical protein
VSAPLDHGPRGIFSSRARKVTAGGLVAGSAEHTIIMAFEWTAQKPKSDVHFLTYGTGYSTSPPSTEAWSLYKDDGGDDGSFGVWGHGTSGYVTLGMPKEATFMIIATKFSNVKNGVGEYHTYIKTPKDGTVWQMKHDVPLDIRKFPGRNPGFMVRPNDSYGYGLDGAIYTTQLFAGKGLPFSVIVLCCYLLT